MSKKNTDFLKEKSSEEIIYFPIITSSVERVKDTGKVLVDLIKDENFGENSFEIIEEDKIKIEFGDGKLVVFEFFVNDKLNYKYPQKISLADLGFDKIKNLSKDLNEKYIEFENKWIEKLKKKYSDKEKSFIVQKYMQLWLAVGDEELNKTGVDKNLLFEFNQSECGVIPEDKIISFLAYYKYILKKIKEGNKNIGGVLLFSHQPLIEMLLNLKLEKVENKGKSENKLNLDFTNYKNIGFLEGFLMEIIENGDNEFNDVLFDKIIIEGKAIDKIIINIDVLIKIVKERRTKRFEWWKKKAVNFVVLKN